MIAIRRADEVFGSDQLIDASRVFPLRLLLAPALEAMRGLGRGWDGYRAEPPDEKALHQAGAIVHVLRGAGLEPDKVLPDASGGVGIYLFAQPTSRQRYVLVSCDNDGDVALSMVDRQEGGHSDVDLAESGDLTRHLPHVRDWLR